MNEQADSTRGDNTAPATNGYVLWDRPVRIIHWLIVLLLPASWWTAEKGHLEVHQWLGFSVLVAVLTRLCWGLIGSAQARFADFLRGPGAVYATLRGQSVGRTPGHNPAGGWSALLLWALLLAQVITGTVNSDDILFTGPFREAFGTDLSDALSAWHETIFKALLGFIVLHIAAIAYYERLRGQRLLRPMITGSAPGRHGTAPPQPLYKALIVAALLVGLVWALIQLAPEPSSNYYF